MNRSLVTQVGNLLCRRLAVGESVELSKKRGLAIRDTADCQSALPFQRRAVCWGCAAAILSIVAAGCSTKRTLLVDTMPPGAVVSVNDTQVGPAPIGVKARWPNKKTIVTIRADKPGFETTAARLALTDAKHRKSPWPLRLDLAPLEARYTLDINCNVDDARIRINGIELQGRTPAKIELTFARRTGVDPWSAAMIDVSKERYQYKPPTGPVEKSFSVRLGPTNFPPDGKLEVRLDPILFYPGPIKRFEVTDRGIRTDEEIVLSQIAGIEREPRASAVSLVSDLPPELPLVETKLAVTPDGKGVVYSLPVWKDGEKEPKGANLWMQRGVEKVRLTDGDSYDVMPAVSSDGQWIYFASDRSGKFSLWRIQVSGKGGIGQITDSPSSRADYEPALSPDGKRVAYTSLRNGARSPQIWLCNPDGTLQTQIREGSEAAWSPDGTRLAYIAPDATRRRDAIWIIDADGSNPRCVAFSGATEFRHPVWSSDGRSILYDCNRALNSEQKPNYDIWMMNADGTGATQLTVNGSYDACPAVTPDGHTVYFLSNRGLQQEMQNNLQIWRMDLFDRAQVGMRK